MDQDIKTVIQYPVGATEFDIPFDYLSRKFVRVSLVSDDNRRLLSNITEYRYVSKTRVKLLVDTTGFDRVEIRRFTSASERIVDFSDGSVLRANDLNVSQLQSAHIAEEARDAALLAMPQDDAGNLDARNRRIVRLAPGVAGTDAVNKNQLDTTLGEAGGILADVKQTEQDIQDYIEKFGEDSAMVRGVSWIYNNGSANGGETSIVIDKPTKVFAVPYIEVNGSRQEQSYHFEFDPATQRITLATPLKAGDFVVVITTESKFVIEDYLASTLGADAIGTSNGKTVEARLKALEQGKPLTPEMYGAVGDGVHDDYYAIQQMLTEGPEGCVFDFDGNKTYYNAFANDGSWIDLMKRNMWIRTKGATFNFNGCKLKRRKPEWNFNNNKNNYNTGPYYTDDHTALLWIDGGDGYVFNDMELDCSVPLGPLVNVNGVPGSNSNYAVGTCMEFGLYAKNAKNIHFSKCYAHHSVFPYYLEDCENITGDDMRIEYTAQAAARVDGVDLMLGGGFKPLRCKNVRLTGVAGLRNVNATCEIEPNSDNVYLEGYSRLDYANSLVIVFSRNVRAIWAAYDVTNGSGLTVRGGAGYETYNIDVDLKVNTATWMGANVFNSAGATTNMWGINIKVHSVNCKKHAVGVYNNAGQGVFIHCNTTIDGWDNATAESGVRYHGRVGGRISGSLHNFSLGYHKTGDSTDDMNTVVDMDVRDRVPTPYALGATSKAAFARLDSLTRTTITSNNEIRVVNTAAGGTADPAGTISFYGGTLEVRTPTLSLPSITESASSTQNGAYIVRDAVGQPNFTIKLYRS